MIIKLKCESPLNVWLFRGSNPRPSASKAGMTGATPTEPPVIKIIIILKKINKAFTYKMESQHFLWV